MERLLVLKVCRKENRKEKIIRREGEREREGRGERERVNVCVRESQAQSQRERGRGREGPGGREIVLYHHCGSSTDKGAGA
jgi:hypothetical protein